MKQEFYHLHIKIRSRSNGRGAVAASAYISGGKLHEEETGRTHNYTKKSEVVYKDVLMPPHAPWFLHNREILWNEVQRMEKRKNAQLARLIDVGLPKTMTRKEQIECVESFIKDNFVSEGMIADWALHDKGDGNPHAHIMLTLRAIDENQNWAPKKINLYCNDRDENGKPIYNPELPQYDPKNKDATSQYRIPKLDENGNQKVRIRKGHGEEKLWEKVTVPYNDWNDNSKAELWRKSWAEHCNKYLDDEHKVDHRSYKRQGVDLIPTIHEGYAARDMEKKGIKSERCEYNREVRRQNKLIGQIKENTLYIFNLVVEKTKHRYEVAKEKLTLTKEKVKENFIDVKESAQQLFGFTSPNINNTQSEEITIEQQKPNTTEEVNITQQESIPIEEVKPDNNESLVGTEIEVVGVAYGYSVKPRERGIIDEVDEEQSYFHISLYNGQSFDIKFDDIYLKRVGDSDDQLIDMSKPKENQHHKRR